MKQAIRFLLCAYIVLVICGCATNSVYTTRLQDVSMSDPPRMDNFGPGEVVAVTVEGYGGETVHVKVIDMMTGRTVDSRTGYIPQDHVSYFQFSDLPAGSYVVHLEVHGTLVDSWKFTVNK